MQDRLSEIKAREAAATPGPWLRIVDPACKCISIKSGCYTAEFSQNHINKKEWHQAKFDAWFISHAREDIPWLIEQVERLRAENERLKHER